MTISIARKTAYKNLLRIERDASYSSELLAADPDGISDRDRNLIYSLTLGVLRKQILLDFIVDRYSKTKPAKLDVEVLIILRLGLFQILFLDKIPEYSAVNESVELTRFARKNSASGLVNAVLRKASGWDGKLSEHDGIQRASIETSHPVWLLEKWSHDFGIQKAVEIATANNSEPRPAFRFTAAFDGLKDVERAEIMRELDNRDDLKRSVLAEGGYTAERIDPMLRTYSQRGHIYFQDQGSQLIGQSVIEKAGVGVLDLCAAPGSKFTQIARLHKSGRFLSACEIHFSRAQLLRKNVALQKTTADVICADGTVELPFARASFDTILVDAPCTGTGTIRRNPEIRYRLAPGDIEQLRRKQLCLLKNASNVLKSNGTIIYSTCSLEREENEDVVSEFINEFTGFRVEEIDVTAALRSKDGFARTFPGEQGSDGFFIACLRRL